jgi:ribosomal protein L37AE/L43A
MFNTCPCCSEVMLRHIRQNSVYWFCPHCWQEMPNLSHKILERVGNAASGNPAVV